MNNLILFLNSFLSYIVLMAIIVAVGAIGFTIGVKWRKAKDAKQAALSQESAQDSADGVSGS